MTTRRTVRALTVVLAVMVVIVGGLSVLPPSAGAAAPAAWTVMPSADAGSGSAGLNAVSCISTTDCYAVGSSNGQQDTLIEHFNGSTWTQQTSPNASDATLDLLSGVSCVTAGTSDSCWAVGVSSDGILAEQLSGGVWTLSSASTALDAALLDAVSCVSATDCTAVGEYYDETLSPIWGGGYATLSMHLAGSTWSVVASPNPGDDVNELHGISCVTSSGTDSCVAVGQSETTGALSAPSMILTGNGTSWTQVTSANPGTSNNQLTSVACTGPTSCVAAGFYAGTSGSGELFEYSQGSLSTWTAPTAGTPTFESLGVSCAAAAQCASVGEYPDASNAEVTDSLVLDSTGATSWQQAASANPGIKSTTLNGVACPANGVCFGVGSQQNGAGVSQPVIESSVTQAVPVVSSLLAAKGPPAGGSTVTIDGSGFTANSTVKFGTTPATNVIFVNSTQLTASAPAESVGEVNVIVTDPGAPATSSVAWWADEYTYVSNPIVTGLSSDQGTDQGGDTIGVFGSGFTGATEVDFTNTSDSEEVVQGSIESVSDAEIEVVTPYPEGDGTYDVTVTTPAGTSDTSSADQFTFGTQSSTTLSALPWAVYPGQASVLSATVSPVPDGGRLTFSDENGVIDGCDSLSLNALGTATCDASYPTVGHHTITASYDGGGFLFGSESAAVEVSVDQQPTASVVDVSPVSPVAGSPVTYTSTISPAPDGGTVAFTDNGDPIAGCSAKTADATTGVATCTTTYHSTGDHAISAGFTGDPEFSASIGTDDVTVGAPASTTATATSVAALPTGPITGQLVQYTATVAPVPDGGTVAFTDDGASVAGCGAVVVDTTSGTAACTTTSGSATTHSVGAAYSGDTLFRTSSGVASVTVAAASSGGGGTTGPSGPTATSEVLTVSPSSTAGKPVTYTATVTPVPDGGTVTFIDGGTPIAGCSGIVLASGVATCTTTYGVVGTRQLVASYSGDGSFSAATATATASVAAPATTTPTSTSLVAAPSTPLTGQLVTLTATVAPVPDGGTVSFTDGGTAIPACTGLTVSAVGTALCQVVYGTAGTHTLSASYSGDTLFHSSLSGGVSVVATTPSSGGGGGSGPAATATSVVASTADASTTSPVTYTATVGPSPDGGTMTFIDDGTPITGCSGVPVIQGIATCQHTYPQPGNHTVVALFSGDVNFSASSSTPAGVAVTAPTTATFSAGPAVALLGTPATYTLTVAPVPDGGTVDFLDDGSAFAGCSAVPIASDGTASCVATFSGSGEHTVTATFSGDPLFVTSSTPGLGVDVGRPTTTTLTATSTYDPSTQTGSDGQVTVVPLYDVVVTITLTPFPVGGAMTVGTVGGAVAHSCPQLTPKPRYPTVGTMTCDLGLFPGGTYDFYASYSGTETDGASKATLDLPLLIPTSVSVTSSSPRALIGVPLTFWATVTPATDGGTVSFTDNGSDVSGCQSLALIDNTTDFCSVSYATVGIHTVTAHYSGTTDTELSSGSVSVQIFPPLTPTTTGLLGDQTPGPGEQTTFRATVTRPPDGGTVGFNMLTPPTVNGTITTWGSVLPLPGCTAVPVSSSGVATCTYTWPPNAPLGQYSVNADYSGDDLFESSGRSMDVDLEGVAASSNVRLTSSSTMPTTGQSTTFTGDITVRDANASLNTPETVGTVTFLDNGASIPGCTAIAAHFSEESGDSPPTADPVAGGGTNYPWNVESNPTCSEEFPAAGSHSITMTYTGGFGGSEILSSTTHANQYYGSGGSPAVSLVVSTPSGSGATMIATTPSGDGYWVVTSTGAVIATGDAGFYGSLVGFVPSAPIITILRTPDAKGYWLIGSDGAVYTFGDAGFYGSMGGTHLSGAVVAAATTGDGKGYWLMGADGAVYAFGDAKFDGSAGGLQLKSPIIAARVTSTGKGYYLVASDGGIFTYGDAAFYGSTGALTLTKPIVGMTLAADGKGYLLVASDGGIFAFGDVGFHGSTGSLTLVKPIVSVTPTIDGKGYYLVASDGGVFAFGDAEYYGSPSQGGIPSSPVTALDLSADGQGYWLVEQDGSVLAYGDAPKLA